MARANAARWKAVADWANQRGGAFRQTRDARGFQIEQPRGALGALRIEWAPSQRSYIEGHELRMRCEMGFNSDLQMMVLARALMERLEKAVFEAYTDTLKTRVDTDTPEEMRWLVMFAKLKNYPHRLVKERFGALGVNQEVVSAWLEAGLSELLIQASQDLLPEERPFVLMVLRGNVYLRVAMAEPTLPEIQNLVKLLETACREAQRVNLRLADGGPWPTTTSVAWQSQPPH
ncbi:hypothetical protein G8A07_11500 [Roseateles sp. DAIF2]|uniref:hypothetical protein n=1 Tax=Roseateles sp. DAIF2 TaxID=2714952 RepID=UPI0018A31BB2|nr:hypothetical protein [Roseateles sp. DAIF2]QPF73481.1 hypothetical protein G8A07_11500 [Roseateles sp. DAIF2]